uniref:Uncharacterized protein LOC111109596 isoform X3 n=1 Tax=Crassostrea virginica TaxID=6565 RepID=A0A8B8BFC9_CRAVI|nr:uncharacterized protein LOC111109596 isoform X3 [Crassostrea virginica]
MKYFVLLALAVLVLSISACAEFQGRLRQREETVPEELEELPPSETVFQGRLRQREETVPEELPPSETGVFQGRLQQREETVPEELPPSETGRRKSSRLRGLYNSGKILRANILRRRPYRPCRGRSCLLPSRSRSQP